MILLNRKDQHYSTNLDNVYETLEFEVHGDDLRAFIALGGNLMPMKAFAALLNIRYDQSKSIDKVIFNDPATIVFWKDGTKTVVKATNEKFDREKGLMATSTTSSSAS